jgi:hypothetical protein
MHRNVRRNRPPLHRENATMVNAPSRHGATVSSGEVARLGAREAARQAALLRMPELAREAVGRPIADPLPGFPHQAERAA